MDSNEMINSATSLAYNSIKNNIIRGIWNQGKHLSTNKLADDFNLSRTPIREALKKLEHDGLVTFKNNAGAEVRKISIDEIKDIYDIRAKIEALAIQKIIEKGVKKEFIDELRQLSIARANATTYEEMYNNDNKFHNLIISESKSKSLIDIIKRYTIFFLSFNASNQILDHSTNTVRKNARKDIHKKIIDALENENSQLAMKSIEKHILDAKNKLIENYTNKNEGKI